MNKVHLTTQQRYDISAYHKQGLGPTAIGKLIGKDKSVVSRELRRNCDKRNYGYRAELADKKARQRMKDRPHYVKFTREMKEHVEVGLHKQYSPEQIVGRARLDGIDMVSHETIYQYIWADKRAKDSKFLYKNLRRHGRRLHKRGSMKKDRGIVGRVDIDKRPKEVDEKTRFGDLEIDTIIGKKHKGAIMTINDRVSGVCWIRLLSGKEAKPLAGAAIKALAPFAALNLLHTITADNGREFADHATIAQSLEVGFYFAKPYHSWERGANENCNGLIRQYITKGADFSDVTPEQVAKVQDILNNRPRKRFGFKTPLEVFKEMTNFEFENVALLT